MSEDKKVDAALERAKAKAEAMKVKADAAKKEQPKKANPFAVEPNEYTHVKHVIGIVSGKGGVGKSTVTCALAVELNRQGYSVGILDADITGPSIPRMLGVPGIYGVQGELIIPGETETGIRVISMNLLLEGEDQAMIWRGPAIAGVVKQFWSDVVWGDLDYLLVDMPPGTGDVPLTVFQSLPVDGILLVTSPQSLVEMIVKKAYNMAEKMDIPILGIIENYSYVTCPDCGRKIEVFGKSRIEGFAAECGIPVCAKLPLDGEIAALADAGRMEMIPTGFLVDALSAMPKA